MSSGVIHYSTDSVYLWTGGDEIKVPYTDLEKKLPKILVERIRTYDISTLIAINGPGGFTSLRIGTLALQTVKEFFEHKISLFSLSKIELYKIGIGLGVLPRQGMIGIGQRKKMRGVSFCDDKSREQEVTMISQENISDRQSSHDEYFIDFIQEHRLLEFCGKENRVTLMSCEDGLCLSYRGKERDISYEQLMKNGEVDLLSPNYMIEPTLS